MIGFDNWLAWVSHNFKVLSPDVVRNCCPFGEKTYGYKVINGNYETNSISEEEFDNTQIAITGAVSATTEDYQPMSYLKILEKILKDIKKSKK